MGTEVGEYIVGAYLQIIKGCDFVNYNVRPSGSGYEGLNEIDVVALDLKNKIAYICEVTTHIDGLQYGTNYKTTVYKIKNKYEIQKKYSDEHLLDFHERHIMFWSPVVKSDSIIKELEKLDGLELIINEKYTKCIDELKEKAKILTNNIGNPFFRMLQILEHLRR